MKKSQKAEIFSKFSGHSFNRIVADNAAPEVLSRPHKATPRKRTTGKATLHKIGGMEKEVQQFVSRYADLSDRNTVVLRTRSVDTIKHLSIELNALVNLKLSNDIRWMNKFFETVNEHLKDQSIFIGCVQTSEQRKEIIFRKYFRPLATFLYTIDFLFRRVLPKLKHTKNFYFKVTDGKNRVLSKAEALGRLVCCGFEIVEIQNINDRMYFAVRKSHTPAYDLKPSYGPIFKMSRVGKYGKMISVYKFRTMHPYSEYLQDYVIKTNGYKDIGKPADDFRITTWGRFMRRYWLDELPQLINVFKGEMKLVGIRPISKRFLNEFPEDIRQLRLKHKPGCVPAYVSLLKQSVSGFIEAETTYLKEKEKHPYLTDVKYLWKAAFNIFTNKIRSA